MNPETFCLEKSAEIGKSFDFLGIFAFLAFINFCVWTIGWLFFMENLHFPKDWLLFWDTANLWASGAYEKLYPGISPGLPFVYPPYFPLFVYPLSFFSRSVAYFVIVICQVSLMLCSFYILQRITAIGNSRNIKLFIVSVSSASWLVLMPLGHISVTYLFLICLGLWLHSKGRYASTGIVMSLLMIKPNIGIIFPLLYAIRREFKVLAWWSACFSCLCLLPLFFSANLWLSYLDATSKIGDIIYKIPPWKHHTLHACLRSLLNGQESLVFPLWLLFCLTLGCFCLHIWYTTKNIKNILPRLYGVAILTIVVCNPYFHHYDAILLVLPAVVVFSGKIAYGWRCSELSIKLNFLLAFLLQQAGVLYMQGGISLVSLPLSAILLIELADLNKLNRIVDNGKTAAFDS